MPKKQTKKSEFQKVIKKVDKYKKEFLDKKEVKQIEAWIKEHPLESVGLGIVAGAILHKLFGKKGE